MAIFEVNTSRIKQSIEEHKQIVTTLEETDVKVVLAVMAEHIDNSGKSGMYNTI